MNIGGFYVCEPPCPELAITGDNEEYGYVTGCYAFREVVELLELIGSRAICKGDKLMLIPVEYLA
jgi:hypothetical protein